MIRLISPIRLITMINNHDSTTTPHIVSTVVLSLDKTPDATTASPQPSPLPEKCSIHVPLLTSTTIDVDIVGDKHVFLNQVMERLAFKINVVTPSGQSIPMDSTILEMEVTENDITIPVALAARINPKVKVSDPNKFARGLVDTINEAISKYGCELHILLPQIIEKKPEASDEKLMLP